MSNSTHEIITCPHTSEECDGVKCTQHEVCLYYTDTPSLFEVALRLKEIGDALELLAETLEYTEDVPAGVVANTSILRSELLRNVKVLRQIESERVANREAV